MMTDYSSWHQIPAHMGFSRLQADGAVSKHVLQYAVLVPECTC